MAGAGYRSCRPCRSCAIPVLGAQTLQGDPLPGPFARMTFASFQGLEEGTKESEQEQQNRTTEERKVPTGETEVGIWSLDAQVMGTQHAPTELSIWGNPARRVLFEKTEQVEPLPELVLVSPFPAIWESRREVFLEDLPWELLWGSSLAWRPQRSDSGTTAVPSVGPGNL